MDSEDERNIDELLQIRLHQNVMEDIQFAQYVLTPTFKNHFNSIPIKVCKECGENFRVTHWCENLAQQIWIPNWEKIIRSDFKPVYHDLMEIQIEDIKEEQIQTSEVLSPHKKESPYPKQKFISHSKVIEDVAPKPPKSKPFVVPSTQPIQKEKKSNISPQYSSSGQKNKLSISSITNLSQKERFVYQQLINWRNLQANRENIRPFMITVDTSLMAIVHYRVSSTNELMQISGITPQVARKYGTEILRIMYRNGMATGINTNQQQKKPTTSSKTGSNIDSNTRKIILGFVCCFAVIVIAIVIASL
jgi:superfamily II DNA helicase RecQ